MEFRSRLTRSNRRIKYNERDNPLKRCHLNHSPSYPPAGILGLIPSCNWTRFQAFDAGVAEVTGYGWLSTQW